jgi:hypothetical protein
VPTPATTAAEPFVTGMLGGPSVSVPSASAAGAAINITASADASAASLLLLRMGIPPSTRRDKYRREYLRVSRRR